MRSQWAVACLVAYMAGVTAAHGKHNHVEALHKRMDVIIKQKRDIVERQFGNVTLPLVGAQTTTTTPAARVSTTQAVVATTTAAQVVNRPSETELITSPAALSTSNAAPVYFTTTTTSAAAVVQTTSSSSAVATTTSSAATRSSSISSLATGTTRLSDLLTATSSIVSSSSATASATAASSTKESSSSGIPKGVLIPLIVAASCAAAVAAIWTIIRKTKFSPSKRFEARMAPIEFDDKNHNPRDYDGSYAMLAHGRNASQQTLDSLSRNKTTKHYQGYSEELNRANSLGKASLASVPLADVPFQASPTRAYQGNGRQNYANDPYGSDPYGSYENLSRAGTMVRNDHSYGSLQRAPTSSARPADLARSETQRSYMASNLGHSQHLSVNDSIAGATNGSFMDISRYGSPAPSAIHYSPPSYTSSRRY